MNKTLALIAALGLVAAPAFANEAPKADKVVAGEAKEAAKEAKEAAKEAKDAADHAHGHAEEAKKEGAKH